MRIRTHVNPFAYTRNFAKIDFLKIFPNFENKLDFEIGCGQSLFIKNYAQNNPSRLIIGTEIRKKAVEIVQEKITESKIDNAFLLHGNGNKCLEEMFEENSIDKIFIFHPDPWPKRRHQKRRIITTDFLKIAQNKLKNSGQIYVATDVEFLWLDILQLFEQNNCFIKVEENEFWNNYKTRWQEISEQKNRQSFFATFCLKK